MTVAPQIKRGLEDVTVEEVMHHGVLACPPEASLRTVAQMMARFAIHAVVVQTVEADGAEGVGRVIARLARRAAGSPSRALVSDRSRDPGSDATRSGSRLGTARGQGAARHRRRDRVREELRPRALRQEVADLRRSRRRNHPRAAEAFPRCS